MKTIRLFTFVLLLGLITILLLSTCKKDSEIEQKIDYCSWIYICGHSPCITPSDCSSGWFNVSMHNIVNDNNGRTISYDFESSCGTNDIVGRVYSIEHNDMGYTVSYSFNFDYGSNMAIGKVEDVGYDLDGLVSAYDATINGTECTYRRY